MESLRQDIFNLNVFDMHNHLDVKPDSTSIVAQDFWDVGEYFWVRRHLWSAGYPVDSEKMDFDKRVDAYVKALERAENTIWVRYLKQGIKDLYGVELKDRNSVYTIDEIIKERAKKPHYGKELVDKIKLDGFIVNGDKIKDYGELSPLAIHAGCVDVKTFANKLLQGENVREQVFDYIRKVYENNEPGIRTSVNRMIGSTYREQLVTDNMTYDDAQIAVFHWLSEACEKYNLFMQVFLGVTSDISKIPGPFNDGEQVAKLYGAFEKYNCIYSLITSSQAQNIDVVNAANVFSNVQADGLWWYNLRPSSYREAFEQRLEELPSIRSSIVATDAYVIEWCYIKANLIKNTLYEFMKNEIEKGHIDREMAIKVSSDWLSGSARELLERRK